MMTSQQLPNQQPPTIHQHHHHHHHPHHHQQQQQHHQQPQRRTVDLRIPAIEKYAYCLCLHVKPTTIFIAVFKLIRALLFASILLNAEFSINDPQNPMGPLDLGSIDERRRSTVAAVTILTRIIVASVSAVAIYAVISGRAALLMPLYAMLLVDFFFALPAFYSKDMDSSFAEGLSDFKTGRMGEPPNFNQYSRYSLMLFSTVTMIVKIYFLCVIWKCYRYLRLIELVAPIRLSEIYPSIHSTSLQYPIVRVLGGTDPTEMASGHNAAPPPYDSLASNMKPPNYEEAMKTSTMVLSTSQSIATPQPPTNTSLPQQQTIVFTDPGAELQQQNISTQVIPNQSNSPSIAAAAATTTANNVTDCNQPNSNSQHSPQN